MATALLVAGPTLTFWIPWQTRFAFTYSYSSVVQSARLLVELCAANFQLTHMSRDDHTVQLIEPWRPKRRQNMIITALTMLPQGRVSARKHQCMTAITTMWTEYSWAFPESNAADDSRAMADNGETKGLITPPPR